VISSASSAWSFGWEALAAIGTLALALATFGIVRATKGLASRTAALASATADDVAGQHRSIITTLPERSATYSLEEDARWWSTSTTPGRGRRHIARAVRIAE
jgi:hypothetical protein